MRHLSAGGCLVVLYRRNLRGRCALLTMCWPPADSKPTMATRAAAGRRNASRKSWPRPPTSCARWLAQVAARTSSTLFVLPEASSDKERGVPPGGRLAVLPNAAGQGACCAGRPRIAEQHSPRWPSSWRPKRCARIPTTRTAGGCWATFATRGSLAYALRDPAFGRGRSGTRNSAGCPRPTSSATSRASANYQGRWMPAAEEAQLRRDLKRGWRVETTHYVVTTNHSLEEGVRVQQLERFYCLWQQAFVTYLADEAELARRFDGQASAPRPNSTTWSTSARARQYNDALRATQPKIDITLGIYLDRPARLIFSPARNRSRARATTKPPTSCFMKRDPVARKWGARRISGSSRASPATWNRCRPGHYYTRRTMPDACRPRGTAC